MGAADDKPDYIADSGKVSIGRPKLSIRTFDFPKSKLMEAMTSDPPKLPPMLPTAPLPINHAVKPLRPL